MSDNLSIRKVTLDDLDSIRRINWEAWPAVSLLQLQDLNRLTSHTAMVWVAESNHIIVGYLIAFSWTSGYEGEEFCWFKNRLQSFIYVDQIALSASFRGKGVGSFIYAELVRFATAEGWTSVICEVNVDPPNPESVGFHIHWGFRVQAQFEGQPSIMFDEPEGFDIGDPPQLQGRSRGWTPVHAQLAALAGCTAITITVVARDQQFHYSNLSTKMRSLIDIRGFFFDLHLQPKYEQLNFDLRFETREPLARIRALAQETSRRCPQLGLFRAAKVPLLLSWYRGKSRTPLFEERFSLPRGKMPEDKLIEQRKRG